jgi:hypothetical protein
MNGHIRTIESLVGEQLSAVSFVQDYVEFHFDGPVIRALTNPIVATATGRVQVPAPGSRDALCSLIAQRVNGVEHEDNIQLRLNFGVGESLTIPLDEASHLGPEAMHFQSSPTGPVQVWS